MAGCLTGGSQYDSDCDGIPDEVDECTPDTIGTDAGANCDGNVLPLDGTNNQTIFHVLDIGDTGSNSIEIGFKVQNADVYFLMDMSNSMAGERDNLKASMTDGNVVECALLKNCCEGQSGATKDACLAVVDAENQNNCRTQQVTYCTNEAQTNCPDLDFDGLPDNELKDKGVVGAVRCLVGSSFFGAGRFIDIPFNDGNPGCCSDADDHGNSDEMSFRHYVDITNDVDRVRDAIGRFVTNGNYDYPEGSMIGLYSVLTGRGHYFGHNSMAVPERLGLGCEANTFGYPCFREDAIPIVVMFTDDPMQNGPPSVQDHYWPSYDQGYAPSYDMNGSITTSGIARFTPTQAEAFATAMNLGEIHDEFTVVSGDTTYMSGDIPGAITGCGADSAAPDVVYRFSVGCPPGTTAVTDIWGNIFCQSGGGGGAAQTCGSGNDCTVGCTNGSFCDADCRQANNCDVDCTNTANCDVDCRNANTCTGDCTNGAQCRIDCTNANNCETQCSNASSCLYDCRNANNCDIDCGGGSSCLIDCSGANNCSFTSCTGAVIMCPNNVIACNTNCPIGGGGGGGGGFGGMVSGGGSGGGGDGDGDGDGDATQMRFAMNVTTDSDASYTSASNLKHPATAFPVVLSLYRGVPSAIQPPVNVGTQDVVQIPSGPDLTYLTYLGSTATQRDGHLGGISGCGADGATTEVLFTFRPVVDAQIVIDSSESAFGTTVSLHEGLPSDLPDDPGTLGVDRHILVGASGNDNDTFNTARSVSADGIINGDYVSYSGDLILLSDSGGTAQNTPDGYAGRDDYDESVVACGVNPEGTDVVYTFDVDQPTRLRIDTEGSNFKTVVSLHDGAPPVKWPDDTVAGRDSAGTAHFINNPREGLGNTGSCTDTMDNDGDGLTDAADPDCSSPISVTNSSFTILSDANGTTGLADTVAPSCGSMDTDSGDSYFRFSLSKDTHLNMNVSGRTGTTVSGEAYNTPWAINRSFDSSPPPASPGTDPVINEFVNDHNSADTREYIEIAGQPDTDYGAGCSTDTWPCYTLVVLEGDSESERGEILRKYTLGETDGSGLWTTGFLNDQLQNGTSTILLVENIADSGVANGTDIDTNDDGVIDPRTPTDPAVMTGIVDLTTVALPADIQGDDLLLTVDGGVEQTVSFTGAQSSPSAVRDRINNQTTDLTATLGGNNEIILTTDTTGPTANITITGGAAAPTLGLSGEADPSVGFNPDRWDRLVDSVAVNDGGASDLTYSVVVLTPSYDGVGTAVGGASRIASGRDTDAVTDWVRNDESEGLPGLGGFDPIVFLYTSSPGTVQEYDAVANTHTSAGTALGIGDPVGSVTTQVNNANSGHGSTTSVYEPGVLSCNLVGSCAGLKGSGEACAANAECCSGNCDTGVTDVCKDDVGWKDHVYTFTPGADGTVRVELESLGAAYHAVSIFDEAPPVSGSVVPTQLFDVANVANPPDSSCTAYSRDGHLYWFCSNARTWTDAESRCVTAGGNLVRVDDTIENSWVRDRTTATQTWIGAQDVGTNVWQWSDNNDQFWTGGSGGSTVGGRYARWNSSQPSSTSSDCVSYYYTGASYYEWDDRGCASSYRYVCEDSSPSWGSTELTPAEDAASAYDVGDPDNKVLAYEGSTVRMESDVDGLLMSDCGATQFGPDVVFEINPAVATDIEISTAGSDFPAIVGLFDTTIDATGFIECDAPGVAPGIDVTLTNPTPSALPLSHTLVGGRTYYAVVTGTATASNGQYSIKFSDPAAGGDGVELVCGHELDVVPLGDAITIDADVSAGQDYYIVVESNGVAGNDYLMSVFSLYNSRSELENPSALNEHGNTAMDLPDPYRAKITVDNTSTAGMAANYTASGDPLNMGTGELSCGDANSAPDAVYRVVPSISTNLSFEVDMPGRTPVVAVFRGQPSSTPTVTDLDALGNPNESTINAYNVDLRGPSQTFLGDTSSMSSDIDGTLMACGGAATDNRDAVFRFSIPEATTVQIDASASTGGGMMGDPIISLFRDFALEKPAPLSLENDTFIEASLDPDPTPVATNNWLVYGADMANLSPSSQIQVAETATNMNESVNPVTREGAQFLGDIWNTRVTVGGGDTDMMAADYDVTGWCAGDADSPDAVYEFFSSVDTEVRISTAIPAPGFDTVIALYDGTDGVPLRAIESQTITIDMNNALGTALKKKITIDSTQVSSDLTDFPLLVDITDTDLRDEARADGLDIFFRNATGTTTLDFEIEEWDSTTGHLVAWVRVPTVSSSTDTEIYVYYGDDSSIDRSDADGTWDDEFRAVYHMDYGGGAGVQSDSSGHGNDLQPENSNREPADAASPLHGGALTFVQNGGDEPVLFAAHDASQNLTDNNAFTISAWVNLGSSPTGLEVLASKRGDSTDSVADYQVYIKSNGTATRELSYRDGTERVSTITVSTGSWRYVAVMKSGGDCSFHIDGISVYTEACNVANSSDPLWIGGFPGPSSVETLNGDLDELHISGVARGTDWLLAEYRNQRPGSNFFSLGVEENVDANPNDAISQAEMVDLGVGGTISYLGNTAGLVSDVDSGQLQCGAHVSAPDAIYEFVLTETTTIQIDATNSTNNPVISLFDSAALGEAPAFQTVENDTAAEADVNPAPSPDLAGSWVRYDGDLSNLTISTHPQLEIDNQDNINELVPTELTDPIDRRITVINASTDSMSADHPAPSCGGVDAAADALYRFVPTEDGQVRISTQNPDRGFDTVLALYDGRTGTPLTLDESASSTTPVDQTHEAQPTARAVLVQGQATTIHTGTTTGMAHHVAPSLYSGAVDFGGYTQTLTVNYAGGTSLTDHQVRIDIDSGDTHFWANYGNQDSIRVWDQNDADLALWIEKFDSTGQEATIWVVAPSIPATSSLEFDLFYGDITKAAISDIEAVTSFGDDFGAALDARWVNGGSAAAFTVAGGELIASTSGTILTGRLVGATNFSEPFVLEARYRSVALDGAGNMALGTYGGPGAHAGVLADTSSGDSALVNAAATPFTYTGPVDTWSRLTMIANGGNVRFIRETDGSQVYDQTVTGAVTNQPVALGLNYTNAVAAQSNALDMRWDWVFVRKHSTVQPTVVLDANPSQVGGGGLCGADGSAADAVWSFSLSEETEVEISADGSAFEQVIGLFDTPFTRPSLSSLSSVAPVVTQLYDVDNLPGQPETGCAEYIWNTHRYWACDTKRTWDGASNMCRDAGYHLAVISSSLENQAIFGIVGPTAEHHHIGLQADIPYADWTDPPTSEPGEWENGATNTYRNFVSGEPNQVENAGARMRSEEGEWEDVPTSWQTYRYICEDDNPTFLPEPPTSLTPQQVEIFGMTRHFVGSTRTMTSSVGGVMGCSSDAAAPDAVFQLEVPYTTTVDIEFSGSFAGAVVGVFKDGIGSQGYLDGGSTCSGSQGAGAEISKSMDAGTWFVVLSGTAADPEGAYEITFHGVTTDPAAFTMENDSLADASSNPLGPIERNWFVKTADMTNLSTALIDSRTVDLIEGVQDINSTTPWNLGNTSGEQVSIIGASTGDLTSIYSAPSCGISRDSNDAIFAFTPTTSANVRVIVEDVDDNAWQPVVALYDGSNGELPLRKDELPPDDVTTDNTNVDFASAWGAGTAGDPTTYLGNVSTTGNNVPTYTAAGHPWDASDLNGGDAAAQCNADPSGNDAFFTFTLTDTTSVTLDTSGTDFAHTLSLWADGTRVTEPTATTGEYDGRADATANNIAMDGNWVVLTGDTGNMSIGNVTETQAVAGVDFNNNDNIQNLGTLASNGRIETVGANSSAAMVTNTYLTSTLTCGSSSLADDMVYQFTPARDASVVITVNNPTSAFPPVVALFDGQSGDPQTGGEADPTPMMVSGNDTQATEHDVGAIGLTTAWNGDTSSMTSGLAGSLYQVSTDNGGPDAQCNPDPGGKDAFYTFTLGSTTDVRIEVAGDATSYNHSIALWDDAPLTTPTATAASGADTRATAQSAGTIDSGWVNYSIDTSGLGIGELATNGTFNPTNASGATETVPNPSGAQYVSVGASTATAGSNYDASTLTCGSSDGANDQIFSFTPTTTTKLRLSVNNPTPGFDPVIAVFDGTGGDPATKAESAAPLGTDITVAAPTGCTTTGVQYHNGHAYFLCTDAKAWASAKAVCETAGTHLVRIDTQAERDFIDTIAATSVWTGLVDVASDDNWRWVSDGDLVWTGGSGGLAPNGLYQSWGGGEPNGDTEDCMEQWDAGGVWNDAACTNATAYVCELPLGDVPADSVARGLGAPELYQGSTANHGHSGGFLTWDQRASEGGALCSEDDVDGADVYYSFTVHGADAFQSGLSHRYSFDGIGSGAYESVGAQHGSIVGSVLGDGGQLYLRGGSNTEYVDLPNAVAAGHTDLTVEAWVTWFGGADWQRVFDFGSNDQAEGSQTTTQSSINSILVTPSGNVAPSGATLQIKQGGTDINVVSAADLPIGTMAHLAVVIDDTGDALRLFVDGTEVASNTTWTGSISGLGMLDNVWLGFSQYQSDPNFSGIIHELRVYNRALSGAEISTSSTAGMNPIGTTPVDVEISSAGTDFAHTMALWGDGAMVAAPTAVATISHDTAALAVASPLSPDVDDAWLVVSGDTTGLNSGGLTARSFVSGTDYGLGDSDNASGILVNAGDVSGEALVLAGDTTGLAGDYPSSSLVCVANDSSADAIYQFTANSSRVKIAIDNPSPGSPHVIGLYDGTNGLPPTIADAPDPPVKLGYVPSNFDATTVTYNPTVNLNCGGTHTFDSSDGSFTGSWCGTFPSVQGPVAQLSGGPSVYILGTTQLDVASGTTLKLVGAYPVILAVSGNVTIDGTVDAGADMQTPGAGGDAPGTGDANDCGTSAGQPGDVQTSGSDGGGGGGGAGFGTPGATGGEAHQNNGGGPGGVVRGNLELVPLLGGCAGGLGGQGDSGNTGREGGAGGGAVQISSARPLTVGASGI
ncbi:MAG: DUF2341 domain-containing protein, partial [Myxococcales bacterium]|nr:DUF2341 domain-containing protein [Myxococcales bacterium]